MIGLRVNVTGAKAVEKKIALLAASVQKKKPLFEAAGELMTKTVIPLAFRRGGYEGEPPWKPVRRFGAAARPLRDRGILQRSIWSRPTEANLTIGTNHPGGATHQEGRTIVPVRRKWLAIPLSPPLSITQARTLKPRDIPGGFVLIHGPEGPGLYRKSRVATSVSIGKGGGKAFSLTKKRKTSYAKGTLGIERVFAFVKKVEVPARPFLMFTKPVLARIALEWTKAIAAGFAEKKSPGQSEAA